MRLAYGILLLLTTASSVCVAQEINSLPQAPSLSSVKIEAPNPWINTTDVGHVNGSASIINFEVDGLPKLDYNLHDAFPGINLSLSNGDHVLIYRVDAATLDGVQIQGMCSVAFHVEGDAILYPAISFAKNDERHGSVNTCGLSKPPITPPNCYRRTTPVESTTYSGWVCQR
jgi:hypothetical protein